MSQDKTAITIILAEYRVALAKEQITRAHKDLNELNWVSGKLEGLAIALGALGVHLPKDAASPPGRAILTEYWAKPDPCREFDWSAVTDNYEPGEPIGYGRTEEEAVCDLKDQLLQLADERDQPEEQS